MINALQIIVHIPVFSVTFPDFAGTFFNMLMTLASFNVIDTGPMLFFFEFKETEPLNDNFDSMGYGSVNAIENLGTQFLGFVFYGVVLPLIPLFFLFGLRFSL